MNPAPERKVQAGDSAVMLHPGRCVCVNRGRQRGGAARALAATQEHPHAQLIVAAASMSPLTQRCCRTPALALQAGREELQAAGRAAARRCWRRLGPSSVHHEVIGFGGGSAFVLVGGICTGGQRCWPARTTVAPLA